MPTRRQTTIGLLSLALGSAAISSAAFSSSTAAGADLRVVVSSELTLTPARPEDPDSEYQNGQHVVTDEDGEVTEIVFKKLNQRSKSTFANLITATNNGNVGYDQLAFEFVATGNSPSEASLAAADSLDVIASNLETTTDEGQTVLLAEPGASLEPGDSVTFGITVDLLPSSSDDIQALPTSPNVDLEITAERDAN
ncbi:hypothetical protein [Halorubrum sp. SY-15]|uniref:hypothetical protein n=1 Tax=Halorubrum sp. SY-15 TaxID=3402277 RepID=UPI003EBB07E3